MWNSWLVLAACAVITQSLPRPDGAYDIPAVPAGKRVQYYVLHDDGNYKYGFDTGAGAYETAVRMGNEQTGSFGFNNAEGNDVRVDYTAGVGGFQPSSSSFTPAEQPEVPVEVPQPVEYSAAVSKLQEPRGDASYSFAYKTADSHRKETSDSDLNIEGEYSFVAPDGIHRQINYIAGSATGFVAEGAHLPVAGAVSAIVPVVPVVYSAGVVPVATKYSADAASTADITNELNEDGSYKFSYDALSSSRSESADSDLNVKGSYSFKTDDGHRRTINYIAGADTGFVADGADIPVAPEVAPIVPVVVPQPVEYSAAVSEPQEPRGDASYSFAYKTADSHRKETSDSDLNVEGEYSFVAPDGIHRHVNYRAGSATGFVAEGAHLPVAGAVSAVVPAVPEVYSASVAPVATRYSADAASTADITNVLNEDGSYIFSYDALSSSRSESADSDLNVKGSYSFKTDDGHRRTINYIAGADTGFVAVGADIPVAPEVAPVASVVPVVAPQPVEYSAAVSEPKEPRGDASYSFAYKTADSHRKETSDSDLNVEGEYSFVAPDGIHRQVNYIAGSATGFVAEGAHLPVAGAVSAVVPTVPDVYSASYVPVATKYSADAASTAVITNVLNEDGSYKFSYNSGTSDREESADSNLNVRGKYSFIADDGVRRRINYIAGSKTGFVAEEGDISHAVVAVEPVVAVIPTVYTAESTGAEGSAGRLDASYKFGYTTNDSDREESADADLNVEGSFSFVADDGERRTVKYKAGSATGFIADGTHLPVAHDLPSAAPISSVGTHGSSASAHVTPLLKSAAAVVPEAVEFDAKKTGDSSYSFEYANSASSRDESADPSLNVKGSFKFVADDGVERTVNYVAGSATGFVAEGTHLPKAGVIPVVSEVSPSLRSAVVPSVPVVVTPTTTALHRSNIVGNVLLRQYPVLPGKTKFGYVFTAV